MSIRMLCPNGHELVTEDQFAGRKVRCPHCQLLLVVPGVPTGISAAPPPLPREGIAPSESAGDDLLLLDDPPETRADVSEADLYEDEDRARTKKRKNRERRHQLKLTNIGLGFHYAKIICLLLGFVLHIANAIFAAVVIGGAVAASASHGGQVGGVGGAAVASAVLQGAAVVTSGVLAPVLGIIGSTLCCWVPPKSGVRVFIIISLVLDLLPFVLFIAALIVGAAVVFGAQSRGVPAGGDVLIIVLLLLGVVASLAAWVLFMIFLRNLAYYLDQDGAGDEAMSIMVTYLLALVGGPVVIIGLAFVLVHIPCIGALALLGLAIGWLVWMLKLILRQLQLIGSLRYVLRARLGV